MIVANVLKDSSMYIYPVSPGDWPDYLSERPLVAGPVRLHGPGEQLLLEAGREAEVGVVVGCGYCAAVAPHLRLR